MRTRAKPVGTRHSNTAVAVETDRRRKISLPSSQGSVSGAGCQPAERLQSGKADLWDSGKVANSQSVLVPYGGRPLHSHRQVFWKVRVWDQDQKVSYWSLPAQFSTRLVNLEDWQAHWISACFHSSRGNKRSLDMAW